MAIRLTQKLMDKVIAETAGQDVIPLVKALKGRENVSEFVLAEEIGMEINLTRNMLYRLYNANLVKFSRKKDKKKGWYIYYWTFKPSRIKELLISLHKKRIERIQERLSREKGNQFYHCKTRCIRLDFESASDFAFKCPECGELLNQEDNSKQIKDLEKELKNLEAELKKM